MGFRRRTRRRALVAGAAMAHRRDGVNAEEQEPAAAPGENENQAQYAPPPADPADEIEHLAKLHESGALTDEEFATAKANALGS